jgi:hypothetical protein
MDGCVKGLSNFIFEIGVSCWPQLPRAASEKVRVSNFLQTNAYKSKNETIFQIFFYNPTGEAFMYIM